MASYPTCPIYRAPARLSLFGQRLVQAGWLEFRQMLQVEQEIRTSNQQIITCIEQIIGRQLPAEVKQMYRQLSLFELKVLFGVEAFDFENTSIPFHQIEELIDTLISIDLCCRYRLIPLAKQEESHYVVVAMVNPDDLAAQDELNRILRNSGYSLQRFSLPSDDYEFLMHRYQDAQTEQQRRLNQQADTNAEAEPGETSQSYSQNLSNAAKASVQSVNAEPEPINILANKILVQALLEEATEIHIEPQEDHLQIRFRIDGVLHQAFDLIPESASPALIARFKLIAGLDVVERHFPQNGHIQRIFDGRKVDFEVSTLPSRYGEAIILRLIDNSPTQLALETFILDPVIRQAVREISSQSQGLFLTVGSPRSGRTTTLYSLLAELNSPEIRVITAEDLIVYSLPGITQVQAYREIGMDLLRILNACLQQSPDVILVGELRDREITKIVLEAARTRYLLLSTMCAVDPIDALVKILSMGIEPYQLNGGLIGIVGQRLMRKICDECRVAYTPDAEELARCSAFAASDGSLTFYRANRLQQQEIALAKFRGQLCSTCKGVGYKGRIAVHVLLRISSALQQLIIQQASVDVVQETAQAEGMKTYLEQGLDLVRQGLTSMDEMERVCGTEH